MVDHPSVRLRETLASWEWTQDVLAGELGISSQYCSDLCRGRASISVNVAIKLEGIGFGGSALEWLSRQAEYDVQQARAKAAV